MAYENPHTTVNLAVVDGSVLNINGPIIIGVYSQALDKCACSAPDEQKPGGAAIYCTQHWTLVRGRYSL